MKNYSKRMFLLAFVAMAAVPYSTVAANLATPAEAERLRAEYKRLDVQKKAFSEEWSINRAAYIAAGEANDGFARNTAKAKLQALKDKEAKRAADWEKYKTDLLAFRNASKLGASAAEIDELKTTPDSSRVARLLEERILAKGRMGNLEVPKGCALPAEARRVLYVDPVKGSDSGDGSAVKPFKNLQAVFDKAGLLVGNERILLASGNHGQLKLAKKFEPEGFVTIEAAPGATPVMQGVALTAASKLMFKGIDFSYPRTSRTLVSISKYSKDIILTDNRFYTSKDMSDYSDMDWVKKSNNGVDSRAMCTTVRASDFSNMTGGIFVGGDSSLVTGNSFQNIVNDNIDFAASDITIRYNAVLSGRNNPANKAHHSDAMQGWTVGGVTNRNIVIDGNLVLHYQPVPKGQSKKVAYTDLGVYRQGINAFDGEWDNVTVSNNVVVTNNGCGIVFMKPSNSRFFNNIVLSSDPELSSVSLDVVAGKDGKKPVNNLVYNNLVDSLKIDNGGGVKAEGNVVLQVIASKANSYPKKGDNTLLEKGNTGSNAVVTKIDAANGVYDVRVRKDGPAAKLMDKLLLAFMK